MADSRYSERKTGDRERAAVAGLVLAAGEGRRFGAGIKQLARFRGRPLLDHAVASLRAAALDRIVVVLGYEAEKIRSTADLSGVEVVICADWRQGQAASLRAGLAALTRGPAATEAVVVILGDQPLISPLAIERLIAGRRPGQAAARAGYEGRPGHPVLLERRAVEAAMELSGDQGAGELIRSLGMTVVPCDGLGSDVDIDTPKRLREVEKRLGDRP